MRKVSYGTGGVLVPPVELIQDHAREWEEQDIDFLAFCDQLSLTIPRSIWTPDLVPAAEYWDVDRWMEPWPVMTAAALATERVQIGMTVADALRRSPPVLAQLGLTMDHMTKGRFLFCLGAGEKKQFQPYGLPREKPFAQLEECLKIIRLLWENQGPVNYDGPIWNLRNAILALEPYAETYPPLMVAGGPGRALRAAATLADGWLCYFPPSGEPDVYAEHVREFRRLADEAGKDPDAAIVMAGFACVIAKSEEAVEHIVQNTALRWDAAALVPDPEAYERMTGRPNPLGPDFSYPRDLIPMDWAREDALAIVDQVPPEAVRLTRVCGTPDEVARQIHPWIEAGATHVLLSNYADLVTVGDFADASGGNRLILDTIDALRELDGSSAMEAVAQ